MIRRALISVTDKTGITSFAQSLKKHGIEIVSTGGTAKMLEDEGIEVTPITDVTQFPEMLDGRVKTLHPHIHGGILARRELKTHMEKLHAHQITPIDLVVVNLYPFQDTIAKADVTFEEAIENIDIGGPAMIRSSAKNHRDVTVIVDPADYARIIDVLAQGGGTDEALRRELAAKAFSHTAAYDSLIAQYFNRQVNIPFPEQLSLTYRRKEVLRYGENPQQAAAYYEEPLVHAGSLPTAAQVHGKKLSYNNINDSHSAIELIRSFSEPTAVVVKHTNPCGVASSDTIAEAYQKAYEADPISIFGGIVVLNRRVDRETASKLAEIFLEIVIAPSFEASAIEVLSQKKNLRILELSEKVNLDTHDSIKINSIDGGALIQEVDQKQISPENCTVVTDVQPDQKTWQELMFAWKVVKHVKSNAIVLTKDRQTVGIGAGQMNRVGSAHIAIAQAEEKADGAIMASDAFFPMSDTVEAAAKAGIKAIIQPGGSIRDQESIDLANQMGIVMVFTHLRHFKH
ncbi:bifunctional phosphoribosylaminoimidazolecarboxamide formyltransferase/IMP cyclohydrolase [Hazenella sp. IB182353]|uniref:bifunctional phosphoribosylaminoimidazolecarboxamide formyltransferase/IMP cyclohydrolase n=1 Tax=Polycladospora coralii TaxID=2771432 RepID=UPI001746F4BE|nr:bifunctional phosphoribosylaminoimidazolecarboxamide formyltransferase/IMP cyclohydrolase [Polycladospora coralii]MBS7531643.1 bifunctional phosphoribosylaminoimidazolecarboxamide formyltransferase/IMP cyclohydrolase [Polycladospora coralii]